MRNFVAVVFKTPSKAYDGLHELWNLDREAAITVHGTAVVHRDDLGQLVVDTKETYPGVATAIGVGVGVLLGALAGPPGAAVGAAGGAGIGAAAGGAAGLIADVGRADVEAQAGFETRFILGPGEYAVIADVSEDWTAPIDTRLQRIGGIVHRRSRGDLEEGAWYRPYYPYDHYLYPYEYRPPYDLYA